MSFVQTIKDKFDSNEVLKQILTSIAPRKEDYKTLSNKKPFSMEYELYEPSLVTEENRKIASMSFSYIVRFRIAQLVGRKDVTDAMIAEQGYRNMSKRPEFIRKRIEKNEPYRSWMYDIHDVVTEPLLPISRLYSIAVHLAYLEEMIREELSVNTVVNVDKVLFDPIPEDIIEDLDPLLFEFDVKFMTAEIIHEESNIIFNPHFGVASLLVDGADADVFIDGTLYHLDLSEDNTWSEERNLRLIAYYIFNKIAQATASDTLGFNYRPMEIERLACYKARYGEIEYIDMKDIFPEEDPRLPQVISEVAAH